MNAVEIIRKKRNKEILSEEEINFAVGQYTKGKIPDYQFSALLMSIYLNGMNVVETAALTKSMLNSGKVIDLSAINGAKIDKHSTGGVGDKTSLILAPICAAAGVNVPMISGRGLGHTGGTLDKLESIPGYSTQMTLAKYKSTIKKIGAALIGQTKDIAPADKLIYALRDVTATVESIPLITGSIMSKKLAEGIDGLVLDVKTGSGAFMKELKDAKALALSLVGTAKEFNKKVLALITDMNQPLGNYIGNWFEVVESVEILQGKTVPDLLGLSLNLSGAMLMLAGKVKTIEDGIEIANKQIESGKAFDKFLEISKAHGGDIKYLKDLNLYPKSKYSEHITLNKNGYIKSIDTYKIGMAALKLGAGRLKKDDIIDPKAGIIFNCKIGDKINNDTILAEIFTDNKKVVEEVNADICSAVELSDKKARKFKMIKEIIN